MANKKSVNEWEEVFKHFDKNDSGTLTLDELREMLKSGDSHVTESQIQVTFSFFDGPEGDKGITLEEFTIGINAMNDTVKALEEYFHQSDTDNSGSLEKGEIFSIITKAYPSMTEDEKEAIFTSADEDGDGKITLEEFLGVCT